MRLSTRHVDHRSGVRIAHIRRGREPQNGYGVPVLTGVDRELPAVPVRALPRPRKERAVHARSTTFHGSPGNIDAGITFVKGEAGHEFDLAYAHLHVPEMA